MKVLATDPVPVFISYSWDGDEHRDWVLRFAKRLMGDGFQVTLDSWSLVPGDQLPEFMERSIRENSFIVIVCTPPYKQKSDGRFGGVGYEGDIMSGEVLTKGNHRKFIPLLRCGDWRSSAPSWLAGKYYVDLRGDPFPVAEYEKLVAALRGGRNQPASTAMGAGGGDVANSLARRRFDLSKDPNREH